MSTELPVYSISIHVAEWFRRSLIIVASVRNSFGSRVCYLPQIQTSIMSILAGKLKKNTSGKGFILSF